jgi:hypothetical protein
VPRALKNYNGIYNEDVARAPAERTNYWENLYVAAGLEIWAHVLGLSRSEIEIDSAQSRLLSNRLVALSLQDAYLQGKVDRLNSATLRVEPKLAIWAVNDEVACAVENSVSAPSVYRKVEPPRDLLPPEATSFHEIVVALRKVGINPIESAIYSRKGKFVLRSLLGAGTEYFFANNERSDGEVPVAIAHRLED